MSRLNQAGYPTYNAYYASRNRRPSPIEPFDRKRSASNLEPDFCPVCNGTGDGMYDGSSCPSCGGSGEAIDQNEQDDISAGCAERAWDDKHGY
jgi:hypothetical protein